MFTQHGDAESQRPHGSVVYERGSFSTDHWSGTLDGGLAKRIDYAFIADQFRSTGEFANDAYRITTGTANIGYHFSDTTVLRAVYREFDSYTGIPGQVFYGLTDTAAFETVRDSALSVRLDDARGKRFTQKVIFGYHRNSTLDVDNSDGNPYTIAALTRTVPARFPTLIWSASCPPQPRPLRPARRWRRTRIILTPTTARLFPIAPTCSIRAPGRTQAARWFSVMSTNGRPATSPRLNVAAIRQRTFLSATSTRSRRASISPASARYQQSSTFGSEFAPRGAVTFRLPTETFLRFSASRGIKEPSLLENFANAGYYVGNPALKPETTQSYEAGLSREWLARRLRTELSVFRNSFHNLIEYDSAVYPGTWQNVDQSWARGAEASAIFRVTRSIAVHGAYTQALHENHPIQHSVARSDRNFCAGRAIPAPCLWNSRQNAGR